MEQMNITNDAVATVSSRLDHVGGVHDEINDQQQADIEKQVRLSGRPVCLLLLLLLLLLLQLSYPSTNGCTNTKIIIFFLKTNQAAALAQLADDWGEKNKAVDREADKLSAAIVKNTADISSLESFKDASTRRLTKETERIDKVDRRTALFFLFFFSFSFFFSFFFFLSSSLSLPLCSLSLFLCALN